MKTTPPAGIVVMTGYLVPGPVLMFTPLVVYPACLRCAKAALE
ncbi:hypothetical protein [Pseudovibrio sp. Ad37]|nr:hypothetical protein [Pseudovibrio sp. Ad37]KZL29558.1 hypothetical protein PsAD37_00119 [Pseudovibrio sp. Ad37]